MLSGDLSPFSQCKKLRQLSIPLAWNYPIRNGLKLPPNLEEVSGLRLNDAALFDQLASLPNLKVIHSHYTYANLHEEEVEAVNRFRIARPNVQVMTH
jgi:hypothetical protein